MGPKAKTVTTILSASAILCTLSAWLGSHVSINESVSMPKGLYVRVDDAIQRGSIVTLSVPNNFKELVTERNYLPHGGGLIKNVVATEGDDVCTANNELVVAGEPIGLIATMDRMGRAIHVYPFCGRIPSGFAYVATPLPSSLDSRYFGPVAITTLTRVKPLWMF